MQRFLALSLSFVLSLTVLSCTSQAQSEVLNPRAFKAKMAETKDKNVLDVRTPGEYEGGFIKGARNLNWNSAAFKEEAAKLDKNKPVFVYCHSGGRSGAAANALKQMGFKKVYDLQGGIMNWTQQGLELEKPKPSKPTGMNMKEYHKLIDQDKLVLVDFYAPWCTPCKKMEPILEEIAKEQSKVVDVQRINADDHVSVTEALSITGLPTILLYKNKKLIWSYIGYIGKNELLEKISNFD